MNLTRKLGFIAIVALTVACSKDNYVETPDYSNAQSTAELKVPEDFDWKTTRNITVKMNPENSGVLIIQNEKGATFQKIFVNANENVSTSMSIPAANKQLFVYFKGKLEMLSISSSTLTTSLK